MFKKPISLPAPLPDPARDFFNLLAGAWRVNRVITGSPNQGNFTGIAQFTPDPHDPDCLYYLESGQTQISGQLIESQQRYIYRITPDGEFWVRFMDARPFLKLDLSAGQPIATATHSCVLDFYTATYRVMDSNQFHLTFDVKGPNKDYRSHTVYARHDPD